MDRAIAALDAARVVTLTGVGGVGKTRLALQVAAEVLDRYRFGAWLCELAPVRSTEGVLEAVTNVFDVTARSGQTLEQALVEFLRDKELLLLLDNCEHVLDEAAALSELLERSCSRVAVLATSREGLGIDGERILAVPSLGAPGAGASLRCGRCGRGAALRGAEAGSAPSWRSTPTTRVGGPGVSAPGWSPVGDPRRRVPAMNPASWRRLDRRFQVLAGGRRQIERHQTLRAVIDWSYDLLSEAEQRPRPGDGVQWRVDARSCRGSVFGRRRRRRGRLRADRAAGGPVVGGGRGSRVSDPLSAVETIRQYGRNAAEQGDTDGCAAATPSISSSSPAS